MDISQCQKIEQCWGALSQALGRYSLDRNCSNAWQLELAHERVQLSLLELGRQMSTEGKKAQAATVIDIRAAMNKGINEVFHLQATFDASLTDYHPNNSFGTFLARMELSERCKSFSTEVVALNKQFSELWTEIFRQVGSSISTKELRK